VDKSASVRSQTARRSTQSLDMDIGVNPFDWRFGLLAPFILVFFVEWWGRKITLIASITCVLLGWVILSWQQTCSDFEWCRTVAKGLPLLGDSADEANEVGAGATITLLFGLLISAAYFSFCYGVKTVGVFVWRKLIA
jgi:hypothetical protein